MMRKIYFLIFLLFFILSIFLVREKARLQEETKTLEDEILILQKEKQNLEMDTERYNIQTIKQRQSDLTIHRDLLMNQSLKLKQDIDIFMREIEMIEG